MADSLYACKIKKTANGRRIRFGGKTRTAQQILSSWRFEEHVQFNEPQSAQGLCKNQAQEVARQEAALKAQEAPKRLRVSTLRQTMFYCCSR